MSERSTTETMDEDPRTSPLDRLTVASVSDSELEDIAEALNGLVGITNKSNNLIFRDAFHDLKPKDRVTAYMIALYARDLRRIGEPRRETGTADAAEIGEACGIHQADVVDHALGDGDLRVDRSTSPATIRLPYIRVRHSAQFLKRARLDHAAGDKVEEGVGGE